MNSSFVENATNAMNVTMDDFDKMSTCPMEHQGICEHHCEEVCFHDELYEYVDRCCDCASLCSLGEFRSGLALVLLVCCLILLAKRRWSYFPVGRAMGAGVCAVFVVVFVEISPPEAVLAQPSVVDMNTIAVLFGLTIISGYLAEFGIINICMTALQHKCSNNYELLWRVSLLTTLLSATVTNDAAVIILTQPICEMCIERGIAVMPFLLALTTAANTGSTLTLIGNPQNVIIASYSGIGFFTFFAAMIIPVFVSLFVNWLFLVMFYWRQLSENATISETKESIPICCQSPSKIKDAENVTDDCETANPLALNQDECKAPEPAAADGVEDPTKIASDTTNDASDTTNDAARDIDVSCDIDVSSESDDSEAGVSDGAKQMAGCIVFIGLMIGFIFYHSITWAVMIGVCALLLIEVYMLKGEGQSILRHVDGPLLVIIASLFIVVGGAQLTGLPDKLYDDYTNSIPDWDVELVNTTQMFAFILLVTVLSTICGGNVPAVMLLAEILEDRHAGPKSWYLLAFSSTVAGNLTLVASIANLIVAEKSAHHGGPGNELTFFNHFFFASWSTAIIIPIGSLIIYWIHS